MAEQGTGDGKIIHPDNYCPNLVYTKAQLQAYPSLPSFKDTIFQELEADWNHHASTSHDQQDNEIYEYMSTMLKYFHNSERMPIDMAMAFQICTVVTLRQTLTQLTQNVHSRALQDRDVDKKRKRSEKIVVNAVMNIIETSVKAGDSIRGRRPNDAVYQELLIELLKSVTNTKQRVQHHYKV